MSPTKLLLVAALVSFAFVTHLNADTHEGAAEAVTPTAPVDGAMEPIMARAWATG